MRGKSLSEIVITVAILCLCAVLFFACEKNDTHDDFARKVQCVEVGKLYHEKTFKGLGGESSIYKITYETSYNRKLDTCLFYAETTFFQGDKGKVNTYIRDVLNNKMLYMMVYGNDGNVLPSASSFKTEQEMNDKYKELFMNE
jgi:hypothetical protein